jgi:N-acetylmuramic acid 6-phosphate etherase
MVDVQACNIKLAQRREAIVSALTGRSSADVADALRRAGGSVKLAVLLLHGSNLEAARAALDRAGGQLRAAIDLVARERPGAGRLR